MSDGVPAFLNSCSSIYNTLAAILLAKFILWVTIIQVKPFLTSLRITDSTSSKLRIQGRCGLVKGIASGCMARRGHGNFASALESWSGR